MAFGHLTADEAMYFIAATAGRHDVRPHVVTTLAERPDMIARQLTRREANTAVHAQVRVPPEQGLIVQRGDVVVPCVARVTRVANGRHDRVDIQHRALARNGVRAAIELIEQ